MNIRRVLTSSLLVLALLVGIGAGLSAVFTDAKAAGPCVCPMVYAPVICDNGKTYSNLCVARCAHAKNCVPLPGYPVPL